MGQVDPQDLNAAADAARAAVDTLARLAGAKELRPPLPLLAVARRLYDARRDREQHLPQDLLGEPAWDALLALFIAGELGRPMNVGQTRDAAGVGPATGGRLFEKLEAKQLIAKDRGKGRQHLVRLTDTGRTQVMIALEAFA